jgi:hypothetical protein
MSAAEFIQKGLIGSKDLLYFTYSLEISLQWPLSILYLYLAFRGVTHYQATSFTLSLLFANGIVMFLYSGAILGVLITTKNMIEADPNDLSKIYNSYLKAQQVEWWLSLNYNICYWISHWVFAFKYWSLAIKIEYIKKGQDFNSMNNGFRVALIVGVLVNLLSALLFSISLA